MFKNVRSSLSIVALLAIVSSCVSVDTSKLSVGSYNVSSCANVYVQDLRPYIVSKDKKPDFLGIIRGGYGNPTNFTTSSGEPLAGQLGLAIKSSLASDSAQVELKSGDTQKTSSEGCRTLVLTMKEWKIDAMKNANFGVDANMEVYSNTGKLLASDNVERKKKFKQGYFTGVKDTKKNYLNESQAILTELLTGVSSAL